MAKKSTVEIERDENNKSGIGGYICVFYCPQMCITCIGVWLYYFQKLPKVVSNQWKKGAHTELMCKNGYCKGHTYQKQKFIELNSSSH